MHISTNPLPLKKVNTFMDFIEQYKIIQIAIAFIVSINLNELTTVFVTSIISPIINALIGSDSKIQFASKTLKIGSIVFPIGYLIQSIIKFSIIIFFIYYIYKTYFQYLIIH
jgi:large conductance mechanosensitive channel